MCKVINNLAEPDKVQTLLYHQHATKTHAAITHAQAIVTVHDLLIHRIVFSKLIGYIASVNVQLLNRHTRLKTSGQTTVS